MTKGFAMRRFVLLGLLLVASAIVTGCQTTDKKEAVGADDSRWRFPTYIYEGKWWGRDELGGLDH
jgi:predicted small secreted protein